jgi:hypothetical protein
MNKVCRSDVAHPSTLAEAAVAGLDSGDSRSSFPNPDAEVSVPTASDSTDSVCAQHANGVGRSESEDWRVAVHESGHAFVHRFFGNEVCGVTIVPDGNCSGKCWGPQGVHAAAVWGPDCVARLTDLGVSRDGDVHGLFSSVQAGVIGLMGGCAAEMTILANSPPKYIGSDVPRASEVAGFVCRTTASIAAFVEHGYQESLAIVEKYQTIVLALAQALIDHPKRTLDGEEIDAAIVPALAAKAAADEHQRRAQWRGVLENAAAFTAGLEN